MKNKFLTSINIFFTIIAITLLTGCENDDFVPEFTVQEPSEQVTFGNTASAEYLLSKEILDNVAERFVWNEPSFGVPTQVNYKLEGSISDTFNSLDYDSGTIIVTNDAVEIKDLMKMADSLGLDADPTTTDDQGNPNNKGILYFRVRAFVGTGLGADAVQSVSETMPLNITLIEDAGTGSGIELSPWGVVGSGANDWGATPDLPFYTTTEDNVIVAYANLIDGEIKFRQNNTWGGDYGDANNDGVLDQDDDNNITVTAGSYKITINWNDNSYTIEPYSWGLVGSATPNGWDGPDTQLIYDYTTDTWKAVVQLIDGEMKVRPNNTWGDDYGDGNSDGILDKDADNNIAITAGYYLVTVDFKTLTYTLEETKIWGAVGSATPNGWDGPDMKFTPNFSSPGIWTLYGITLVDGEMKIRPNDTWGEDYGDANGDGILDRDDDNNIPVSAGTYNITLDFSDPDSPTYIIE